VEFGEASDKLIVQMPSA